MFLLLQLHFIQLFVEIAIVLCYINVGTEQWAVCDASKYNTKFIKVVNNENLDRDILPTVITVYTICLLYQI